MSLEFIMTFLAYVHQIALVQSYFGIVNVAAVEIYFMMNDKACSFVANLT